MVVVVSFDVVLAGDEDGQVGLECSFLEGITDPGKTTVVIALEWFS
jgi:hypothetical protein